MSLQRVKIIMMMVIESLMIIIVSDVHENKTVSSFFL